MSDSYANRNEVLSEGAFLELTGLSQEKFRRDAEEIPGVVHLGRGAYVVVMEAFVRAHEETGWSIRWYGPEEGTGYATSV